MNESQCVNVKPGKEQARSVGFHGYGTVKKCVLVLEACKMIQALPEDVQGLC